MNDWKATAEKLGGVGRSTVFQLWASGQLGSVTIGRRRFSTDSQVDRYIRQLDCGGDAAQMHTPTKQNGPVGPGVRAAAGSRSDQSIRAEQGAAPSRPEGADRLMTPNENVLAPGLVAIAGEFVRCQGIGGIVSRWEPLDEMYHKFGEGFPAAPLDICLPVLRIEALRADPHIDQVSNTGPIEFSWRLGSRTVGDEGAE